MPISVELDEDVARFLDEEVRRSGESFEAVADRALRLGLRLAGEERMAAGIPVAPVTAEPLVD